jgi:hypothetical protein
MFQNKTNDLFILKFGNFKIMGMGIDPDPKQISSLIMVIVPIMVLLLRLGHTLAPNHVT